MKALRKARLSLILMTIGLGALAIFEIVWLKSEYQRQRHLLEMEQIDFFHTAIRSIEDSLLQVMVISPLEMESDSVEFLSPKGSRILFQRQDTSKTMTIVRNLHLHHDDDTIRIKERRDHEMRFEPRRSLMLGMLSKNLADQGDSTHSRAVADMIKKKLESSEEPVPDIEYRLVTYNNEDSVALMGLAAVPYYDVWSRQYYTLEYPHYQLYLFKKIIPQFLFCLVLLAVICLAFYFIYRNFVQERQLAALRRNFISNITHELKTPIATVRVALEAITNFNAGSKPERAEEYINISKGELDRLSMLVDKVLQLSQFEEENAEFKYENVNVKDIVERTLTSMKVQFQKRNAHVNFRSEGQDFTMDGDTLHLSGVIYNLVDNALKYSPEKPDLDIQLTQDNGSMIISIADKGVGITREYQKRIFDKFFRVPGGDEHNVKGHGLGLSYVSHVVQAHHGTIELVSEPGVGSSFKIILPKHHAN